MTRALKLVSRPLDVPEFSAFYRQHFDFVWRSLSRLGVVTAEVPDADDAPAELPAQHMGEGFGRDTIGIVEMPAIEMIGNGTGIGSGTACQWDPREAER